MKRRDAGRVLTFAVTGALLGGVGIGGCSHRYRGPYTNPGPDVGPAEPTDGTQPTEPEPSDHVNEGPVEEPLPDDAIINTVKQPEPEPEPPALDTGTNNVRKVEDEPPATTGADEPSIKYVNTVRQPDPPPTPKK